ncbi:MAG: hypothetical protein ACI9P3_001932 [Bradyrhizobium sp.]|jgi:hypothetical protein
MGKIQSYRKAGAADQQADQSSERGLDFQATDFIAPPAEPIESIRFEWSSPDFAERDKRQD